jgi:WS/DGAT/MGAT family acyltransferase
VIGDELLFPRAMSERDALVWRLERDPALRSTIVAVAVLDRPPSLTHAEATLRRAIRRIPRLRQRVAAPPIAVSTPLWVDVGEVDLDHHLQHLRLPAGGTFADALALAASISARPFDPEKPLWEVALVEGLPGDKAALIQKLHHAMTDGVAGVLLMRQFFDLERDERLSELHDEEPPPQTEDHDLSILTTAAMLRRVARHSASVRRRTAALREAGAAPVEALRNTADELRSLARLASLGDEPLSPLLRGRSESFVCRAFSVSLDSLRGAAHEAGCKVNDAFLAGVAGGWRLYHQDRGSHVDTLRMAIPISLRSTDAPNHAGNDISIARIAFPVGDADPIRRMRTSRRLVRELRNQPAMQYAEALAGFANLLPAQLSSRLVASQAKGSDFVASCVPGPAQALFFARSKIEHFYAFGPPAGAAVNITLVSYLDRAQVAFTTDLAAVQDGDRLLARMKEGFDEVLKRS